jgi:phospholipase/carboxylesterase
VSAPPVAVVREARGAPEGALVLLHGRGADEHDLHPLLDVLDPQRRLVGLTPGAPLLLPPGGRHWYVLRQVGFPDRDTFLATLADLGPWLDAWLADRGLGWERTVLGGFSQGAVMSHALALSPGRPAPAGVLALSGFVPTVDGWAPDLPARAGLPVTIAHGRRDPVIPVELGRAARDLLEAGGLDVTYRESDVGHQIEPHGVPDLVAWVAARVPSGAPS